MISQPRGILKRSMGHNRLLTTITPKIKAFVTLYAINSRKWRGTVRTFAARTFVAQIYGPRTFAGSVA